MADRLGRNADEVSHRWRGKADRVGDHGDKWGDQYKNIGRLEEEKLDEFADSHDGIGEPEGPKKKKKKEEEKKDNKKEEKKEPAAAAKVVGKAGSAPMPGVQKAAMPSTPVPTVPKQLGTPSQFIMNGRDYQSNQIF
jgi:hypothetical protein